jgi:hypothetical protein
VSFPFPSCLSTSVFDIRDSHGRISALQLRTPPYVNLPLFSMHHITDCFGYVGAVRVTRSKTLATT